MQSNLILICIHLKFCLVIPSHDYSDLLLFQRKPVTISAN